jgi:hypothetical protein
LIIFSPLPQPRPARESGVVAGVHKIKHFSLPYERGVPADDSGVGLLVCGPHPAAAEPREEPAMATGETGFDDVTFDLISVQYHSLKAGHDYGQYVRDARNAGQDEIAAFFEEVMAQDSKRAHRCHEFLARLGGTDNTSPQSGA